MEDRDVDGGQNRGRKQFSFLPRYKKGDEFKKSLRDQYLEGWAFAALWADSAPVTAFSTMESWRKNYNKGSGNRKRRRTKAMPQARIADMLLYTAAD